MEKSKIDIPDIILYLAELNNLRTANTIVMFISIRSQLLAVFKPILPKIE